MTNAASALTRRQIDQLFAPVASRYRLLGDAAIGEPSGFGAVWKAHDQWLARDVALKFSNSDMTDELRLCRDIEGQTVRVFDYFRADGGWNAYAMELLEAPWKSVSAFIREHRYRAGDLQHYFDCFEIARSLLAGLAQIHGRPYSRSGRFVHADIKPDNLFVRLAPKKRPDSVFRLPPAASLVRILDMGISTRQGGAVLAYTPAYSDGKKVARPGVDLYAVAVTFIELLTGKWPSQHVMGHKARIRKFVESMSSGSAYVDALAVDFACNCAGASSRPGETVRPHLRHLEQAVFGLDGLDLVALRAFNRFHPQGASKETLAALLFGIVAPSRGWHNRTELRIEGLKDVITQMYKYGMLFRSGQRYAPR